MTDATGSGIPTGPIDREPLDYPTADYPTASDREAILRETFRAAGVELGAYDDANGNGHFDYPAGDTLLGIAPRVRLVYLARQDELAAVQSVLPGAALGFNLFITVDGNDCTHDFYPSVPCKSQAFVPFDSTIVLALEKGAKFE